MRHLKKGWKLKRTSSHRKALLRNLAISLLEHKKIVTTVAKAKALRPFVEKIITRAKRAVLRERNGQLPEGQTVDVYARRLVGRLIHQKGVLQELFDTIAPAVLDRPGGYTRIVKLGFRRGDAAELAAIELVDWSSPQDGAVSMKSKKKSSAKKKTQTKKEQKTVKDEKEKVTEETSYVAPPEGPVSPGESQIEPSTETSTPEMSVESAATETSVPEEPKLGQSQEVQEESKEQKTE
ncbi:MAG: 50S ribosomal protein L17 [Candidatus Kapaibacteriota bacterium]|jgi:large subunit ribosomal protein L17